MCGHWRERDLGLAYLWPRNVRARWGARSMRLPNHSMHLYELLKGWEPTFTLAGEKIHLASYNGRERPMDVFIAENFVKVAHLAKPTEFPQNAGRVADRGRQGPVALLGAL